MKEVIPRYIYEDIMQDIKTCCMVNCRAHNSNIPSPVDLKKLKFLIEELYFGGHNKKYSDLLSWKQVEQLKCYFTPTESIPYLTLKQVSDIMLKYTGTTIDLIKERLGSEPPDTTTTELI